MAELADMWYKIFTTAGIPESSARIYSYIFSINELEICMIPLLTKEMLKELGILPLGHILTILNLGNESFLKAKKSCPPFHNSQSKKKVDYIFKESTETTRYKTSRNIIQPNRPSPPENVRPIEIQGESVTLVWEEPKNDGGAEITNYIVEKRLVGSLDFDRVLSFVCSPSCKINLVIGNEYDIRVLAQNRAGTSDPCYTIKPIDLYYGGEADSVEHPQSFFDEIGISESELSEHVAAEHSESSVQNEVSVEQPQSFSFPVCGGMKILESAITQHVAAEHSESSVQIVSSDCASQPGGEPNHMTEDFSARLALDHRNRDINEPPGVRHIRRIPHTRRGMTNNRGRLSQMLLSSTGCLSLLSSNSRDSMVPIPDSQPPSCKCKCYRKFSSAQVKLIKETIASFTDNKADKEKYLKKMVTIKKRKVSEEFEFAYKVSSKTSIKINRREKIYSRTKV